jgi:hypothetical protein
MFEISPALNSLLEFAPFPSAEFRMQLVKIILADMAVTVAVESAVHLLLYKASSLCLNFAICCDLRAAARVCIEER